MHCAGTSQQAAYKLSGMRRNILLFPRGNREVNGKAVSLYLNVADHESAPLGWSRHAKFNLSVTDHKDPDKSMNKGTTMPPLRIERS